MVPQLAVELPTIPHEGVRRDFITNQEALGISDPELLVVQPVQVACEFFRVDREVVVRGTLRAAVRLTCGRCAEEFALPLHVPLDAIYLPTHDISSERVKDLEADDDADVYSYVEQIVDIAELVRDKLLFSIPLQPHCVVGCKGLCPSCGVNRNTVKCQCADVKLGSPFELLKGLRFSEER